VTIWGEFGDVEAVELQIEEDEEDEEEDLEPYTVECTSFVLHSNKIICEATLTYPGNLYARVFEYNTWSRWQKFAVVSLRTFFTIVSETRISLT